MYRLLLFFFIVNSFTYAQEFSSIRAKVTSYKGVRSVEKLANYIKEDFKTEENRVKALYSWLTNNVRYDLKEFYNPNREKVTTFSYQTLEERDKKIEAINNKIVNETILKRRAVCEGYARTLAKVCSLLNIKNEIITGYVRTSINVINKPIAQPNHAWNAVKINNKWIYIDATWGAGAEFNGKWIKKFSSYYYDIPKRSYFKTHLPDETVWKLKVGRIDKETFYKQPIYSNSFLNSNIELNNLQDGVLHINKKSEIQIKLINLNEEEVLIGFLGFPQAYKPEFSKSTLNNETVINIRPPGKTEQCFLLINREVAAQFLIK